MELEERQLDINVRTIRDQGQSRNTISSVRHFHTPLQWAHILQECHPLAHTPYTPDSAGGSSTRSGQVNDTPFLLGADG
jgi:hypothetical protein